MRIPLIDALKKQTQALKDNGLYKAERQLTSAQQTLIKTSNGEEVLNFCANNYLGLANHPALIKAAQLALGTHGLGMASVRFICGTQQLHIQLEQRLSSFLQKQDTILYSSCFDANTGLFETLLESEDAIISDSLNHASIIDGIRLSKAQRFRYANNDMQDLEKQLQAAAHCRYRMIATDGVFSMDGIIANLPAICDLADKYQALVMVDDSHAVGFMGERGAGTADYWGVTDRVDIVTGTLGKALGGAAGGYVASYQPIIEWLRQRSRPYLFSNSLAPVIAGATLTALDIIEQDKNLRQRLHDNSAYFRTHLTQLGFNLVPGQHPIIPILLGDAKLATTMANRLLQKGIYVIGFSYPVVPQNQARIRTQISAAHTQADLDKAISAIAEIGKELKVI